MESTVTIQIAAVGDDANMNVFWSTVVEPVLARCPSQVSIHLPDVRPLSLAQMAAVVAIATRVRSNGGTVSYIGAEPDFHQVVEVFARRPEDSGKKAKVGFVRQVGLSTIHTVQTGFSILVFAVSLVVALIGAIRHPQTIRWRDFFGAAAASSTDALPVTVLLCSIVGFIIAFQTMPSFEQFGMPSMVGVVIGVSMVRELGPLITAIILAGRSGSAFAAELGTMTVTNEIDALRALDLEPVRFLVVPRLLAVAIMAPLLSILATLAGLMGGYLVLWDKDISFLFFYDQLKHSLHPHDFMQAVFKMFVFSLLVGSAGCLAGLQTADGPGAVGRSATRAVVAGIVLVILADGLMGAIFYSLGW
ncbi:MAG: ABC transporter permease [Planctomycetota bacterium]|nr:ABC transporter permease [Planctomycetota bacterium]MDA1106562.1 ABC transporter permease [Planctomycetota bacterium]